MDSGSRILWFVAISAFTYTCAQDVYISTSTEIKKLSGNVETSVVSKPNSRFLGLAADLRRSKLYFVDVADNTLGIYRTNLDGSGTDTRIIQYERMQPVGLAVDWVFEHLYWTDSMYRAVMMSNLDGTGRVAIVTEGLSSPRGIAVDPKNMKMYIGDQGTHKLLQCDLDGQNCRTLQAVDNDMFFWPNQITVNHGDNKVYWTDGWIPHVRSCDLSGGNCMAINTNFTDTIGLNPLFGITFTTATSYHLTALHNKTVLAVNGGGPVQMVVSSQSADTTTFIISSGLSINQPSVTTSHPCKPGSHSCSDICLPSANNRAVCTCPSGSGKLPVNGNCQVPSEFLLYTNVETGEVGVANPGLTGSKNMIIRGEKPVAVTYDPVEEEMYFSDVGIRAIYKCKMDGRGLTQILNASHGVGQVEGLALDFKQRRLYFSNTGYEETQGVVHFWHSIEMVDLGDVTQRRRIVTNVEKPRALYIDSDNRMLYYTDWGDNNAHVGSVRLDGYQQNRLYGALNPNGMVVINDKLYVTDSRSRRNQTSQLIVSNLDGSIKNSLALSGLGIAFAITKKGSDLLMTDFEGAIGRYNTAGVLQGSTQNLGVTNVFFTQKSASIATDNGKCSSTVCSDICVTSSNRDYPTCLCPSYQFNFLENDRQTCARPTDYLLVADIDGIMMIPTGESDDRNVYNVVPATSVCGNFHGLARDKTHIYFSSYLGSTIYRGTLTGSDVQEFMTVNSKIVSLALYRNTLYWTGITNSTTSEGGIYSKSIDRPSDSPTEIISGLSNPYGIAVFGRALYWTDDTPGYIKRLLMGTGSNSPESLMMSGVSGDISGLAWSPSFWTLVMGSGQGLVIRRSPEQSDNGQLKDLINTTASRNLVVTETAIVFTAPWTSSSYTTSIFLHDILHKVTRPLANSLVRPGQIVSVGQVPSDSPEKPGVCPSSSSLSNCNIYACQSDFDCYGNKKCCRGGGCSVCVSPASNSFCSAGNFVMEVNGTAEINCQSCRCTGTSGACQAVTCPSLGNCPSESRVQQTGECCPSCIGTTVCSEKPTFSQGPSTPVEVILPSDSNVMTFDLNTLGLTSIIATSCSGQPLPITLSPTQLPWKKEAQTVTLTATDKQGSSKLDVRVKVKDITPPTIDNCPTESIEVTGRSTEDGLPVTWQPIIASDNSGSVKKTRTNGQANGALFPPGTTKVQYQIFDGEGNRAGQNCEFSVVVKLEQEILCTNPPPLHNGYLSCEKSGSVLSCSIQKCYSGFVMKDGIATSFTCGADGNWVPEFPDAFTAQTCFKPVDRVFEQPFELQFNCPNANFTLRDIQDCLQRTGHCPQGDITLCDHQHLGGSTRGNTVTIRGTTVGTLPYISEQTEYSAKKTDLQTRMQSLNSKIENFFKQGSFESQCPAVTCPFSTYTGSQVSQTCPYGATEHQIMGRSVCAECAPGTMYVENGPECKSCMPGYYQDKPGQKICLRCPQGQNSIQGAFHEGQCSGLLEKDPERSSEESSSMGIYVGVGIAVVLAIILIIVLIVVLTKRRSSKKGYDNGALKPPENTGIISQTMNNKGFDLEDDEYASLSEHKMATEYEIEHAKQNRQNMTYSSDQAEGYSNPYQTIPKERGKEEEHKYGKLGETKVPDETEPYSTVKNEPYSTV